MAIFKTILVPVDSSTPSDAAVALAIRTARDQGSEIVFLHVCEVAKMVALVSAPAVNADPSYAVNAERETGEAALRRAAAAAQLEGIKAVTVIEDGSSVESILDAANRYAVDLIVIGSHGRGGIPRAFLGSVTEAVLRRAGVPVLVTRVPS